MNRRAFSRSARRARGRRGPAVEATRHGCPPLPTSPDHVRLAVPTGPPQQIAMVLHPRCIPLDVFGPHAVFAALGNVQVHLVWKTRDTVIAATGVSSNLPPPLRRVRPILRSSSCLGA